MVCCYNSEKFLSETLDSIIHQSYTNWEIVAINDGSSDNTEKIIQNYINKGIQIIYHYQKNKGFASARNKAMELANGNWIAIIDHDDICLPNRLEIQANHIQSNPNAKLLFANIAHFSERDSEIRRHFDRINPCRLDLRAGKAMNNLLIYGCFVGTQGVVFNKEAAISVGCFDILYKYLVDYEFFIRIGIYHDLFAGEETVSKWRIHEGQTSKAVSNIHLTENRQVLLKYFCFKGVTNRTRFAMIFNLFKKYVKQFLIKLKLIS